MILDSNILIYFTQSGYESLRVYLETYPKQLKISAITQLEVFGYHRLVSADKILLENWLQTASVVPITNAVIAEAIRLRQQRKRSLGDSIIAATGLLYQLPVLTNNVTDFTDISGLTVVSMDSVMA